MPNAARRTVTSGSGSRGSGGGSWSVSPSCASIRARSSGSALPGPPGQSFFSPTVGLTAVQNMLQANPSLNLIVGSDQGIEGGAQALAAAHKTGKVILVGYGASAAALQGVASGAWYGDVAQAPASEGRLAVVAMIKALRDGKSSGGIDPVAGLPANGVVTKANASQFTAEWPG